MIKNIKLLFIVLLFITISCKNNVVTPDTNNLGSNNSSNESSGSDNSGTGGSGSDNSGTGGSGSGNSGTGGSGSGNSGTGGSGSDNSGTGGSGSDNSGSDDTKNAIIVIEAKSLKNNNMKSAEGFLSWFKPVYTDIRDYAYFTYGISATAYAGGFQDFSDLVVLYKDGVSTGIKPDKIEKININSSKDFVDSRQEFVLNDINTTDTYIELTSDIRKYNSLTALGATFVDTDNFGKGGSGVVSSRDTIVKLKYDNSQKKFVVYSSDVRSVNRNSSFSLAVGERKDISITYSFMGQQGEETIDVIYTIEFKKN